MGLVVKKRNYTLYNHIKTEVYNPGHQRSSHFYSVMIEYLQYISLSTLVPNSRD